MPFSAAFHTYTPTDTVTNTNLNGNINQIITQGNAIDNTFVGPNGFFASQIIPTSSPSNSTFGGAVAYFFSSQANGIVPLTITGNAGGGQTSHVLDVLLQQGGTNLFSIDPSGNVVVLGNLNVTGNIVATGTVNKKVALMIGLGFVPNAVTGTFPTTLIPAGLFSNAVITSSAVFAQTQSSSGTTTFTLGSGLTAIALPALTSSATQAQPSINPNNLTISPTSSGGTGTANATLFLYGTQSVV
jgi:hypothetical protein